MPPPEPKTRDKAEPGPSLLLSERGPDGPRGQAGVCLSPPQGHRAQPKPAPRKDQRYTDQFQGPLDKRGRRGEGCSSEDDRALVRGVGGLEGHVRVPPPAMTTQPSVPTAVSHQ